MIKHIWNKRKKAISFVEHAVQKRLYKPLNLPVLSASSVSGAHAIKLAEDLYDPSRNTAMQQGIFEILLIENGRVWPAVSAIARDDSLFSETLFSELGRQIMFKQGWIRDYPALKVDGRVATIGYVFRNYYNRMFEGVARLYSLRHEALRGDLMTLVLDGHFTKDEQALMRVLLPEKVSIKDVGAYRTVESPMCVHLPRFCGKHKAPDEPEAMVTSPGFIPYECLDWLREGALRYASMRPISAFREKVFVSRGRTPKRNIVNNDDVESHLIRKGFQVIQPDKMPLAEQIACFSQAKIVVAQHGAALANLAFSRDIRVLEIHAPGSSHYPFRKLCEVRNFPYASLVLEEPPGGTAKSQQKFARKDRDGYLSVDLLDKALSEIG